MALQWWASLSYSVWLPSLLPTAAVTGRCDTRYRVLPSHGDQPAERLHLGQSLVLQLITVGCSTQGAMVFITSSKKRGSLDWKGEKKPLSILEPHPWALSIKVNKWSSWQSCLVFPVQDALEILFPSSHREKYDCFSCKRIVPLYFPFKKHLWVNF